MGTQVVIVQGIVRDDGTVEVEEKVNLPPGKVQVTLVSLPDIPQGDPFWQRMGSMWAGQSARGHVPRSTDDVEAERRAMRDEWDDRMAEINRIQDEAERLRSRRSHG
jgi:hypothetical protein